MSPQQQERMMRIAANARLARLIMTLEGGFDALARGELDGWSDTLWPAPGLIRAVPAVNAQGLRRWRHATAEELLRWAMAGCQEWGAKRHPVIAFGTIYRENELAVVSSDDVTIGSVLLTTMQVTVKNKTPQARLKAILRDQPDAMALCVVPRG